MLSVRILLGFAALHAFVPMALACGCGSTSAQPAAPPSATSSSEPAASVAPVDAPSAPSHAPAAPSASGDVELPASSAKAWNNAQSDGAAPVTDRNVSDYQAIVQNNRDKFRACYDASLAASPGIQGRVTVRFVLSPDGSLKEGAIDPSASDITKPDLERCLVAALRSLKFPPSKRGMESTVRYPFNFKPGSKH